MAATLNTTCGPVVIRPTRSEDAAALRDLRLEGLWMHPEAFMSDHSASAARGIEWWTERARLGAGETNQVTYVAQNSQGELVAMCGLFCEEGAKVRHSGNIWGVYVRPAWRGLKIADALLEACESWARTRAVRIVRLAVVTSNTAALRCYQRRGFTQYGISPEVIFAHGRYHDEILMAKQLCDPQAPPDPGE
jgi:ribosomal protein S18 acetylase RimI-like enzyme